MWTLLTTCGVSDVAQIVPAPASVQGRICDAEDHWLNVVPWVVLVLGVVLAVVLAAPPDSCSPEQRAVAPAYACSRAGNG